MLFEISYLDCVEEELNWNIVNVGKPKQTKYNIFVYLLG